MLTNEIINALQAQYNKERQNAVLYESLAACFAFMNLEGFEKFMHAQAADETGHARKFFDYLNELGQRPQPGPLAAVTHELNAGIFGDTLTMFQMAYAAEIENKSAPETLAQLADESGDQTTEAFLNPLLTDQQSSIHEFEVWLTRLTIAQGDGAALLALDGGLQ